VTGKVLSAKNISVRYGASQVLFDAEIEIGHGEFVSLLGRNGMGKTTFVKALMGMKSIESGTVFFCGQQVAGKPDYVIARLGMGIVPEGRGIFPNLSVHENLVATAMQRKGSMSTIWTVDGVYELFPGLRKRIQNLGSDLSGGEQQMLAIGRALMTNPQLLILDEATEGLAPLIRHEIWSCLAKLKNEGPSLLVIDKNLKPMMGLANRHYILEKGRVVWKGNSSELSASPEIMSKYLSL
jgi:branched-chain amino acid transport system ATP-binding protein